MIHIQGLNYAVKNRTIIKDLNIFIDKGEFVSIIGANGAGKSTLLKLIAGELKSSSGQIVLRNKDVADMTKKEMAMFRAYLHQSNVMDIPFTVEEVVAMGRYQKHACANEKVILAIAKAFCKAGFTVMAVLHDLNMVAQYSDRVIMMKGGRVWWYGSPNEVFKQQHIYTIFGIDSLVQINPKNLCTEIQAIPIEYDLQEFNSVMLATVI